MGLFENKNIKYWNEVFSEKKELQYSNFAIGVNLLPQIKPIGNLLELGCGDGRNLLFLAKNAYYNLNGVDFSKVAINKLNKFAKEDKINIQTQVADITNYKFQSKFDTIITTFTLHLFKKSLAFKIINNMKENINIGGLNLISTLIGDNLPKDFLYKPSKEDIILNYNQDNWKILKSGEFKSYLQRDKDKKYKGFYLIAEKIK